MTTFDSRPSTYAPPAAAAPPAPDPAVMSPRHRLAVALALPVALGLALALGAAGADTGAALLLSVWVCLAPGTAIGLAAGVQRVDHFWLCSAVAGTSMLVLVSLPMAWFGWWHPVPVFVVLATLTLVAAGWSVRRLPAELRTQPRTELRTQPRTELRTQPRTELRTKLRTGRRAGFGPGATALVGLAIGLIAARLQAGPPEPGGLTAAAGWPWAVGALVAVAAFGWAWSSRTSLAIPSLVLCSIVVASQAAMYGEPGVIPAARHIGIAEFVVANGRLEPGVDIYQSWSGLFTAAAFTKEVAGLGSLFGYATWWGVAGAVVAVLAVRCLAGRFLTGRRAWLAAVLFGLGNSLNTSFFAPQVFGLVAALTIAVLLLGLDEIDSPRRRRVLLAAVLLLSCALAVVHQLSPYLLVCALTVLVLLRVLRPWFLPGLVLAPAVLWAVLNRGVLKRYVAPEAFGRLFHNLQPPAHPQTALGVSLANRITFGLPAVALLVIGVIALVALATRRTRTDLALALAAGSPVLLMFGTDYGSEGIFRVVLFALPWLTILACRVRPELFGPVFSRAVAGARRSLVIAGIGVLFVVNVVGLTGMDWTRFIRAPDVEAVQWLERTAAPDSSVLTLGTSLATPMFASAEYRDVDYVSREALFEGQYEIYPRASGADYHPDADLVRLTDSFTSSHPCGERYALATEANAAFDQRYGQQLISDQQRLAGAMDASPQWRRVLAGDGVVIWRYTGAPAMRCQR